MRVIIHARPPVLLVLLIVLVAVVSAGCGDGGDGAADEPAPPPTAGADAGTTGPGTTEPGGDEGPVPTITQDDGNRTVSIRVDGEARLQLGGGLTWDQPLVRGDAGAVELSPVEYFADPGFVEWAIRGVRPGEAVISASGSPAGDGRPQRFEVTIRVEG